MLILKNWEGADFQPQIRPGKILEPNYQIHLLTIILPIFFVLKILSPYACCIYIQKHFRLLLIVEANNLNPEQNVPVNLQHSKC